MPKPPNKRRTYALIDKEGKVIEYFRVKALALSTQRKLKMREYKVVPVKELKKEIEE